MGFYQAFKYQELSITRLFKLLCILSNIKMYVLLEPFLQVLHWWIFPIEIGMHASLIQFPSAGQCLQYLNHWISTYNFETAATNVECFIISKVHLEFSGPKLPLLI